MDANLKKILKALSLALRHLLEGEYGAAGQWHAGDLERRLNALGVWRDRAPLPADELPPLTSADREARDVVDAYLALRHDAGIPRDQAVAEFVRETAYTWANRLLALRCMEARGLIDEVILQKPVYGGRSLEHHRLARRHPELCMGEDDGLFAVLEQAFERQARHLPLLFDPQAPAVALRPSVAALKRAVALLSGIEVVKGQDAATDEIFKAPDALGWAYQYWNTEEKNRVFEKVRTQEGAKIEGADIVPATQLYTEPYMVKFLVQNSLGALWMGMYPESRLYERWEYYVRDADRAPVHLKPVREIPFLDPAVGSGHFLLEAFDLFYAMYLEEGEITDPEAICASILQNNLFGIDIDERAVQIAEAALWMKAAERASDFQGAPTNLVATNIRLPKGKDHLEVFLAKYPEDRDLRPALEVIFEGLEHADELGSLLQTEEPVEKELRDLQARYEESRGKPEQTVMFAEMERPKQGKLPLGVDTYDSWRSRTLARLKAHFAAEAQAADLAQYFFNRSAGRGLALFDLLARRYDVVAANPPYLGTKKQGQTLKVFLKSHYSSAQYDLYAAFIVRARSLLNSNGLAALITRSSWLSQKWYTRLRKVALDEGWLQIVIPLGTGAFEDFGGDVVDVALQIISLSPNTLIRGRSVAHLDNKALGLRSVGDQGSLSPWDHSTFRSIPGNVITLEAAPGIVSIFDKLKSLRRYALVTDCVVVVSRFLRFWWERPLTHTSRWKHYSKGGSVDRWRGNELFSLDWEHDGARLKSYVLGRYPPSKFRLIVKSESVIGYPGLTWTTHATGTFAVRKIGPDYVVSSKGPGIFCKREISEDAMLGLLNSHLASYLMRIISPGSEFGYKYVAELPVPILKGDLSKEIEDAASRSLSAKERILRLSLVEISCQPSELMPQAKCGGFWEYAISIETGRLASEFELLKAEGEIESLSFRAYEIDSSGVTSVYERTGLHPWLHIASGSLAIPIDSSELVEAVLSAYSGDIDAELIIDQEPVLGLEENATDESDQIGNEQPLAQNTHLGQVANQLSLHPEHVFRAIRRALTEGQVPSRNQQEDVRCLVDTIILHLLGHRWPKQIEAGEPVPDWADADGIIPLTETASEPTLLDRVRERTAAEFEGGDVTAIEREFEEITGKPLEQWLTTEFFKHHTRQFKKRPIAWQIQSGRFTARQKPAFACLVYYHKLDGAILTTIQSQYVRPLRQRYETEMRGIESIPAAARSARQDARRVELEAAIHELRDFDGTLEQVAAQGFASQALEKIVAQEPLDRWCSIDGVKPSPEDREALFRQEQSYIPDINDGVRVNVAPMQKAGLLAANVLAANDVDQAIANRAEWRADERRWCREGKLPQPGWWE
jgi:hypothetical protein